MTTCKLIAITNPLVEGINNADEFIAYCARISNPSNQMNVLTAPKLISYLLRNKHFSPFEMVSCTMDITTTRDIGRQLLRHRSFSFQEFSARYSDPTKALGFVTREARLQDTKNRQNSISTDDKTLQSMWNIYQENMISQSNMYYNWALENGIAKEQARAILPEGLTLTRIYMTGSLRSWIHYIDVRNTPGVTQKEHVDVACLCQDEIIKFFPSLSEYFEPQPTATELHP